MTTKGKIVLTIVLLAVVGFGVYRWWDKIAPSGKSERVSLNVDEVKKAIQAAKVAVESAQENFRLAQGRFDAGVGTILEVTDAQLALTQAQNTEAQALADFRIAQARLDRALGRR